jgi:hypothetical protein
MPKKSMVTLTNVLFVIMIIELSLVDWTFDASTNDTVAMKCGNHAELKSDCAKRWWRDAVEHDYRTTNVWNFVYKGVQHHDGSDR